MFLESTVYRDGPMLDGERIMRVAFSTPVSSLFPCFVTSETATVILEANCCLAMRFWSCRSEQKSEHRIRFQLLAWISTKGRRRRMKEWN